MPQESWRRYELPFGKAQCRGTSQPSHWGDTTNGQCHRDGQDASIDQRDYEDYQHQAREGQQGKEEERDEPVKPASDQASDHSLESPDDETHRDGHEADGQRDTGSADDPREHVAGILVWSRTSGRPTVDRAGVLQVG